MSFVAIGMTVILMSTVKIERANNGSNGSKPWKIFASLIRVV